MEAQLGALFLVFKDTQLSPDYTAVRTAAEPGLQTLDWIATAGHNGS